MNIQLAMSRLQMIVFRVQEVEAMMSSLGERYRPMRRMEAKRAEPKASKVSEMFRKDS